MIHAKSHITEIEEFFRKWICWATLPFTRTATRWPRTATRWPRTATRWPRTVYFGKGLCRFRWAIGRRRRRFGNQQVIADMTGLANRSRPFLTSPLVPPETSLSWLWGQWLPMSPWRWSLLKNKYCTPMIFSSSHGHSCHNPPPVPRDHVLQHLDRIGYKEHHLAVLWRQDKKKTKKKKLLQFTTRLFLCKLIIP